MRLTPCGRSVKWKLPSRWCRYFKNNLCR